MFWGQVQVGGLQCIFEVVEVYDLVVCQFVVDDGVYVVMVQFYQVLVGDFVGVVQVQYDVGYLFVVVDGFIGGEYDWCVVVVDLFDVVWQDVCVQYQYVVGQCVGDLFQVGQVDVWLVGCVVDYQEVVVVVCYMFGYGDEFWVEWVCDVGQYYCYY